MALRRDALTPLIHVVVFVFSELLPEKNKEEEQVVCVADEGSPFRD
jgi:hypothetical protein